MFDLFNSDNYYGNTDEWKELVYENDPYSYEDIDDVDDDAAFRYALQCMDADWEDARIEMIDATEDANAIIGYGAVTRWDGSATHVFVEDDMQEALYHAMWNGEAEPERVWIDDDGELRMIVAHHDGRNEWKLKILTQDGEYYIKDWEYGEVDEDLSEGEMYAKVENTPEYSEAITIEQ